MKAFINKINNINAVILESASSSNWESLAKHTATRHQLLEDFFEHSDINLQTTNLIDLNLLKDRITQTDDKVLAAINKEKQTSIRNSLNLKNVQTALNEYQTNEKNLATN
ncbi:hypothetical protein [Aliikangiella sp. IMCC44359]|uniref:hypothetical protein n=1 Tax=Aliikangiella sp. IMCC44359 TaxID=3459125 RepID=UPI00403AD884